MEVHQAHSHDDDTEGVVLAKAVSMAVLFVASMICGTVPLFLAKKLNWVTPENAGNLKSKNRVVMTLLSFGGGVLLSTTFMHLIPEVDHNVEYLVVSRPQGHFYTSESTGISQEETIVEKKAETNSTVLSDEGISGNSTPVSVAETSPADLAVTEATNLAVSEEGIFGPWFSILSNGSVTVSQRLDRSRAAVLTLPVTVIDASALTQQQADGELIITIVDVNRHAPMFSQPAYEENLVEEQPMGSVLNTYSATDRETPIAAMVISPRSPYFQIDNVSATGQMNDFDFSIAHLLMCSGFFIMYLVEELVHMYIHRREKRNAKAMPLVRNLSVRRSRASPDSVGEKSVTNSTADLIEQEKEKQKDIEHHAHGHSHHHSHMPVNTGDDVTAALRGLLIVLALSIHELFEGLAVGLESSTSNVWYMLGAISAHKLVIAFCIGVELIATRTKTWLAVIYITTFAIVSPLGIGIGLLLVGGSGATAAGVASVVLQGLASGTLLYVIFFEIWKDDRTGILQYIAALVGFCLMFGLQLVTPHTHSHGGHDHGDHDHGHSHGYDEE